MLFRYYFELFDNHNDDDGMAGGQQRQQEPTITFLARKHEVGVVFIFHSGHCPFHSQMRSGVLSSIK